MVKKNWKSIRKNYNKKNNEKRLSNENQFWNKKVKIWNNKFKIYWKGQRVKSWKKLPWILLIKNYSQNEIWN